MTTEQRVTLKELKELEAKATNAPWHIKDDNATRFLDDCFEVHTGKFLQNGDLANDSYYIADFLGCGESYYNTTLTAATRNALPELIRVIELAEEALDYALSQMQPFCSDEKVKQALSEIRKMKGE